MANMAKWMPVRQHPGRETRARVKLAASIQVSGERNIRGQILDLSKSGFRLTASEPLLVGQLVEISRGNEASVGQIRWVDNLEAGGVFIDPLRVIPA